MLKSKPLTQKEAAEFIAPYHRHHGPVRGDKHRVGAVRNDGVLVGVVQVGRPVSRMLDDGKTLEVVRLCTDGSKNVCSYLYAKAARIAFELGYDRIITYILENEPGTSLEAAGWMYDGITNGGEWGRESRPRETKAPTCPKQRWVKPLNKEAHHENG